jgi:hypothetical protein
MKKSKFLTKSSSSIQTLTVGSRFPLDQSATRLAGSHRRSGISPSPEDFNFFVANFILGFFLSTKIGRLEELFLFKIASPA